MSGEVCLGILGLGTVGSAVAVAVDECRDLLRARGLRIDLATALVREPAKVRACRLPFTTADPDVFFSRPHDVIVEVLGGIDPACALVERALVRGTAVVSANKSLIAANGARLRAIAARTGAPLRYEASVVAGVPFLHALANRPLAGAITRVDAILNGTSNYILTSMARDASSFADALERAQALGYAEPSPENDVSGRDAAEKLSVLLHELCGASVPLERIRRVSLSTVTADQLALARKRGRVIKPLATARLADGEVVASVAPVELPLDHPLARVDDALNGVLLEGRLAGPLFFSGPGAGPEITAATILDDVAVIAGERLAAGAERWV